MKRLNMIKKTFTLWGGWEDSSSYKFKRFLVEYENGKISFSSSQLAVAPAKGPSSLATKQGSLRGNKIKVIYLVSCKQMTKKTKSPI